MSRQFEVSVKCTVNIRVYIKLQLHVLVVTIHAMKPQRYSSNYEITTFLLADIVSSTFSTEKDLQIVLKAQFNARVNPELIAYCSENHDSVVIFDVHRSLYSVAINHVQNVKGITFKNANELIVADSNGYCLYDLTTRKRTINTSFENTFVHVLFVMGDNVVGNQEPNMINVWDTKTNIRKTGHFGVLDIVPIDYHRILICPLEGDSATITDLSLNVLQHVCIGAFCLTLDAINENELLVSKRKEVWKLDIATNKLIVVAKNLNFEGHLHFLKIVDHETVLLQNNANKVYLCDLRANTLSELFQNSNAYFPFFVKGSRVFYYAEGNINGLDVRTNEVVLSRPTVFKKDEIVTIAIW